jgi:hypothetical protein
MQVNIKTPTNGDCATSIGTTITTNAGEQLKYVRGVDVHCYVDEVVTATIELVSASYEGTASAVFTVKHPVTGVLKKVKQIQFEDGGEVWPSCDSGVRDVTTIGSKEAEFVDMRAYTTTPPTGE